MIGNTFGDKPELVREIFQLSCKYLLCVRTPCSRDFEQEAKAVGVKLGLPLYWMEAGLENLEAVMFQAIGRNG